MTAPKVAVVTPAYNVEAFVAETIDSVLAQTLSDWEMVVVDDGSVDGTADVVSRYADPRIKLLRQRNSGQSAAQNKGLSAVTADYVVFLDADDRLRPDALARLAAALDGAPAACVAYGNEAFITEEGGPYDPGRKPILVKRPSGDVLAPLLRGNFLVTGALIARRQVLRTVGGFDAGIVMAQDWELWCRLAAEGEFVFIGGAPVLEYRMRQASIARTVGADISKHWQAIDAVFGNPRITRRLSDVDRRRLRRLREGDAYYFVGKEAVRASDWPAARRMLWQSLMHGANLPRTLVLLLCAILGTLPAPVRERIGG